MAQTLLVLYICFLYTPTDPFRSFSVYAVHTATLPSRRRNTPNTDEPNPTYSPSCSPLPASYATSQPSSSHHHAPYDLSYAPTSPPSH